MVSLSQKKSEKYPLLQSNDLVGWSPILFKLNNESPAVEIKPCRQPHGHRTV